MWALVRSESVRDHRTFQEEGDQNLIGTAATHYHWQHGIEPRSNIHPEFGRRILASVPSKFPEPELLAKARRMMDCYNFRKLPGNRRTSSGRHRRSNTFASNSLLRSQRPSSPTAGERRGREQGRSSLRTKNNVTNEKRSFGIGPCTLYSV